MSVNYDNVNQDDLMDMKSSTDRDQQRDRMNRESGGVFQKILYNRYVPFVCLFALCVFIGIGTPLIWNRIWRPSIDLTIESDLRYDCSPLRPKPVTEKTDCDQDVCLWDDISKEDDIRCYYRMERDEDIYLHLMPRYNVSKKVDDLNYILTMAIPPPFIKNLTNENLEQNPIIQHKLSLTIKHYTSKHLSVLIKPEHEDEDLWSKHLDYNYQDHDDSTESEAEIQVRDETGGNFFQLKITRRSNEARLFNMGFHSPFIFANGHIEITILLINDLFYGLGQSNQPFRHNFIDPTKWNLFNQYHDNLTQNATTLFGSHPFFMGIDDHKRGSAYGVLLVNTFPIEALLNSRPSLTLRTIGGHLEFHYFLGPKPEEVVQQLQNFIHKPAMPPYWALGFHMCHTKCSLPSWKETVQKLQNNSIPIESDCGTSLLIKDRQGRINTFQGVLKNEKMKWISAQNPHLPISDTRIAEKWKNNVLLEHGEKGKPYQGTMFGCDKDDGTENAQPSSYPDFFNEKTMDLLDLDTNADGYLFDMNTPVNLANNNRSCLDMLKRYPWHYYYFAELNDKNPCMDITFSDRKLTKNLDVVGPYLAMHNLYGFKQSQAIYRKLMKSRTLAKKRPFIMSLSTFIGSGRFGGHVSTPLNGTWEMLRFSMKQMLDFSLFGIPMTGFPAGGYKGDKRKDNLLRQWYQLASMQPFMIAYSGLGQEDTALIDSIMNAIRSLVKTRYQILPYYYTLFYKAYINGSLVAQPLFFQFPTDEKIIYKIDEQFMLGPALMVAPNLYPDKSSIGVYFPKGRWYDFYSGHISWNNDGGWAELSIVNLNIHLRGGHMVMQQDPKSTTTQTRIESGYNLIGGFDLNKKARGELYVDNGIDPMPAPRYMQVYFEAEYSNITIKIIQKNDFCRAMNMEPKHLNFNLETIKMFGVVDKPSNGSVNIYKIISHEMKHVEGKLVKFDPKFGVLSIDFDQDLCRYERVVDPTTIEHQYFINWTYTNWINPQTTVF